MTKLPPRVHELANLCREECERWAADDQDLEVYGESLGGMCAVASYTLWKLLRSSGFRKARFAFHPVHCWVEFGGWVIDITATQFNRSLPRVHTSRIGDPVKSMHPWSPSERVALHYEAFEYDHRGVLMLDGWPDGQVPLMHLDGVQRVIKTVKKRLRKQTMATAT